MANRPRLLIKARPTAKGAGFAVNETVLRLTPLFPGRRKKPALGAAATAEWHTAELPAGVDTAQMWDMCHQLQARGMGAAGGAEIEFAEPDLEQQWHFGPEAGVGGEAFAAAAKFDCSKQVPPDAHYPSPNPFDWRWHLDAKHSGLDAARALVMDAAERVTIAHLDTGYRDGHALLPPHLDTGRARSFVDGDPNAKSAVDPGAGANGGHGTGTLGLLAGNVYEGTFVGGAPFATVVPVRVANSVVLFSNSSIAKGLQYAIDIGADVVSMSMGGVPSQLWADVVNDAYMAGLTMVTAAGNNYGPGKVRVPRFIVYPARFRRVLAACGVMFDGSAYADFKDPRVMAGSYGPDSKMDTAIAGYTGNTPWAMYDCPAMVRYDGVGTSSATPQVAAAAACWLQKNRAEVLAYPEKWMRVEAVRRALLTTADDKDREHFGSGKLRADRAMNVAAAGAGTLVRQMPDSVSVPFLGPVLSVLFGAAEAPSRHRMLQIEAAQLLARSGALQQLMVEAGVDPDRGPESVPAGARQRLLEALADEPTASKALRQAVGRAPGNRPAMAQGVDCLKPTTAEKWEPSAPTFRSLRVFAFDPVLRLRVETERLNETTLDVRWEKNLQPGPVGEYLEVVDVDPSSEAAYAPVDLNHPHLLASDGLAPAEGVPQFHQQMVYAVAMTTIQRFEDALGRTALWAPRLTEDKKGKVASQYVQRLRIYPHALREANAYYSPSKSSLLFGYFQANTERAVDNLPGGLVFTCLSHDVVAHETTHALMDGIHRYYQYQTNDDIAAFHEAFADIVALFQHFSIPAALRHTIAKSRGDLRRNNLLADLAQQFGQASSGSRALRSALGTPPKTTDYAEATEAHDRGAVLLAAVFQAFLEIYEARVEDLRRLATGGTGVLPPGDIPVDLVNRLAKEASATAARVLTTCIRALDYCPPVDLTFGDYLRALITADMDLEPEDELNYRTAFISGFRARGIFPSGVRNLSEENLRWQEPSFPVDAERIRTMVQGLDLSWGLTTERRESFLRAEQNGRKLWDWMQTLTAGEASAIRRDLGFYIRAEKEMPKEIKTDDDGNPVLQISGVRPARRINSRNEQNIDLVVEAVQKYIATDAETGEKTTHRGGCTLLIDLQNYRIRYAIRKRVDKMSRIAAEQKFMRMAAEGSQSYFESERDSEPFAMLHRGC